MRVMNTRFASALALKLLLTGDLVFPYWPRTVENRAALRTAVGALAAVLIAFKFHLQSPYWSGMSVVIVANLYTGSIIDKALMRITGTIVGAVLGFFIAGFVANSFLLYLLSCFLIVAVSVYFYYYSKHGYAYLLGALCAFIIISQIAVNPQNAFLVAIWRPVEIALGVIVFAVSVYAIFPNHLKDNISSQINELFNNFKNEFNELASYIIENKGSPNDLVATNLKIKKKLRKATELIASLNREIGVTQAKADELRAIINCFYTLSRQIQYLTGIPYDQHEVLLFQTLPIAQVFAAIQDDLSQLQTAFLSATPSLLSLHTETLLAEFEQAIESAAAGRVLESDFIYSFLMFLHQVHQNLSFLHSILSKNPITQQQPHILISKQERLKADNALIKQSIKAGFAVLLALGFWLISNWPGGINGIISSLVISIRLNLLEMKNVIIHRLVGCMLGGGLALASLAIVEMNLYDFIMIMFFGVWGFSYFMFKHPKYAYMGLQANIALIIALAQEGGPPTLLDPPLQRLAGVVIGIVASFIVANVVWRSDVWTILNRYLEKIYKFVTFNLEQTLFVSGQKKLHELANLFWLSRNLIESLGDMDLTHKKQKRLAVLRQKFESLVMTQATISHILSSIDREQAKVTADVLQLDLLVYEKKLIQVYEHRDRAGALQLCQELQQVRESIHKAPIGSNITFNELRNVLAYFNALKQLSLSLYESKNPEEIEQALVTEA